MAGEENGFDPLDLIRSDPGGNQVLDLSPQTHLVRMLSKISIGATVGCYDATETGEVTNIHTLRRESEGLFRYTPLNDSYTMRTGTEETLIVDGKNPMLVAEPRFGRRRMWPTERLQDLDYDDLGRWTSMARRSVWAAERYETEGKEGFVPAELKDVHEIVDELKVIDSFIPGDVDYEIDLGPGLPWLSSFSSPLGRGVDMTYKVDETEHWVRTRTITLGAFQNDYTGLTEGLMTYEQMAPVGCNIPLAERRFTDDPQVIKFPAAPVMRDEAIAIKRAVMAVGAETQVITSDGEAATLLKWASDGLGVEEQIQVFRGLEEGAAAPEDLEAFRRLVDQKLSHRRAIEEDDVRSVELSDGKKRIKIKDRAGIVDIELVEVGKPQREGGLVSQSIKPIAMVRLYNNLGGEYIYEETPGKSVGLEYFLGKAYNSISLKNLAMYSRRLPELIPIIVFKGLSLAKQTTLDELSGLMASMPVKRPK